MDGLIDSKGVVKPFYNVQKQKEKVFISLCG